MTEDRTEKVCLYISHTFVLVFIKVYENNNCSLSSICEPQRVSISLEWRSNGFCDTVLTKIRLLSAAWYRLPASFQTYSCDTCGRQYRSKISLQRHKRLECGKEAQFKCMLCHARFKHKHSLLRHYNVHVVDVKSTSTFENFSTDRSTWRMKWQNPARAEEATAAR